MIGDTAPGKCLTITLRFRDRVFWGALVGATCNEGRVAEAGAAAAAGKSSADLLLLQSLDAKIEELIEAGRIPRSSAASVRPSLRLGESPTIDSTQTVRPLSSLELEACEVSRWFVIELMLSVTEIGAAQIPNLRIFEEYRLYSVEGRGQSRPTYALRLGFFSSEVAAAAVVRYLASYFPAATIMRVSIAEHERFADKLGASGKDIGDSGKRLAIKLVTAPVGSRGAPRYRT